MSTMNPPHARHPRRHVVRTLGVIALAGSTAACGVGDIGATSVAHRPSRHTTTTTPTTTTTTDPIETVEPASLSAAEIHGLLWMRAEEQLAHDVYLTLAERWDLAVFSTIAASEARHVDAVIGLLDAFGIDDTSADNPTGTFTDPDIQALYDTLVAEGGRSITAAVAVGAQIEELDIRDLRDRAAATDSAAIRSVYANLERASGSHLRAFTTQLAQRGETYVPQYLAADDVAAIVAARPGRGR